MTGSRFSPVSCSASDSRRTPARTWKPRVARARAVACPMPEDAPVTTANWFSWDIGTSSVDEVNIDQAARRSRTAGSSQNAAISRESLPALPGERRLPLPLADHPRAGYPVGPLLGHGERVAGVGRVMARDDERRGGEGLEALEPIERDRPRGRAKRRRDGVQVSVQPEPLAGEPQHHVPPLRVVGPVVVGLDEAVDPSPLEPVGEPVPVRDRLVRDRDAARGRADRHETGDATGVRQRVRGARVRAHGVAGDHDPRPG